MLQVPREEVMAALDCARCRSLVETHAPPQCDFYGPRRVDLGTGAAYAIAKHYGAEPARVQTCPDCGRVVDFDERHNCYWTYLPLDRDVVGR